MICSIDGCNKPVRALGFCRAHHLRNWRYGNPLGGGEPRGNARKFIDDHVNYQGDDCLIWPFAKTPAGYGDVNYPKMRHMLAHRVMCVLAHGKPPSKIHQAAHSCGNGQNGCVNPNHLYWATPQENIDDKKLHGTQPWGEQIHTAKLTFEQARIIKYTNESPYVLAAIFNVSPATIMHIKAGRTWKGI
jgi:hypothetical protein